VASLGIGVEEELLTLALTHRSYAYENGGLPTNERLEFLGDSVLSIVVTERLYREHPDLPEGQLAKLRASGVNMHALAGVARRLELGELLHLGRGEEIADMVIFLASGQAAYMTATTVFLDGGIMQGSVGL